MLSGRGVAVFDGLCFAGGLAKRVGRGWRVAIGGARRVRELFRKARRRLLCCPARWQDALSQFLASARHVADVAVRDVTPPRDTIVTPRLHNTRARPKHRLQRKPGSRRDHDQPNFTDFVERVCRRSDEAMSFPPDHYRFHVLSMPPLVSILHTMLSVAAATRTSTLVHPHQTPGSGTSIKLMHTRSDPSDTFSTILCANATSSTTRDMQCSIAVASILQGSKYDASRSTFSIHMTIVRFPVRPLYPH